MLSSFVKLFLTTQKEWNVVNISIEQDFSTWIQEVDKANPDVIILQQGDLTCNSNLPMILMQRHQEVKLITLNLDNNMIEVFNKENVLVKSGADLIAAISADWVVQNSVGY